MHTPLQSKRVELYEKPSVIETKLTKKDVTEYYRMFVTFVGGVGASFFSVSMTSPFRYPNYDFEKRIPKSKQDTIAIASHLFRHNWEFGTRYALMMGLNLTIVVTYGRLFGFPNSFWDMDMLENHSFVNDHESSEKSIWSLNHPFNLNRSCMQRDYFFVGGLSGLMSALMLHAHQPIALNQNDLGREGIMGLERIADIIESGGFRKLYRGLSLTVLYNIVDKSLLIGLFLSLKHWYESMRLNHTRWKFAQNNQGVQFDQLLVDFKQPSKMENYMVKYEDLTMFFMSFPICVFTHFLSNPIMSFRMELHTILERKPKSHPRITLNLLKLTMNRVFFQSKLDKPVKLKLLPFPSLMLFSNNILQTIITRTVSLVLFNRMYTGITMERNDTFMFTDPKLHVPIEKEDYSKKAPY